MSLDVMELSYAYPTPGRLQQPTRIFHSVSWRLAAGHILHIQGANGSGKTTLLKCLVGLLPPLTGCIHFDGQAIATTATHQQRACYIGHQAGISAHLSVWENVVYDLCTPEPAPESVIEGLKQLALWDLRHTPCAHLSAGQKRRVSLLRLYLSSAKLWVLDEPLVGLDRAGMTQLVHWIHTHLAGGGLVVYASHQRLPQLDAIHQEYPLC